jgi:hypothetical protein
VYFFLYELITNHLENILSETPKPKKGEQRWLKKEKKQQRKKHQLKKEKLLRKLLRKKLRKEKDSLRSSFQKKRSLIRGRFFYSTKFFSGVLPRALFNFSLASSSVDSRTTVTSPRSLSNAFSNNCLSL